MKRINLVLKDRKFTSEMKNGLNKLLPFGQKN